MRAKSAFFGAAALALLATGVTPAAMAAEGLYIPLLTYRTGPFAGSGILIADGMRDYFTLLNERDGGIGGVRLIVEECETGYNAQKGVECYEGTKGRHNGALLYNPYSTGITLQLIPKAPVDKIPILAMGYGLSAAAVGEKFPWVFNVPATYWDQASAIVKFIRDQEGGSLKGKKIGFIYLDVGYGREPIPLLEQLASELGFELMPIPVGVKEMQNQSSHWLQVRRGRPDWMVMWGWGAMSPTAVKEAVKIKFPMERFIGVWWSGGEDDARAGGPGAKGYRSVNFHGTGTDYPALQDILDYVVATGQSTTTDESKVGENLYNRGVMNAVVIAEAIHAAQQLTGKAAITAQDLRLGLENLDLSAERLQAIGLGGFTIPLKTSCADHAGSHPVYIQQWDGASWRRESDWITPMTQKVRAMLETAAENYIADKPGWQTQSCN